MNARSWSTLLAPDDELERIKRTLKALKEENDYREWQKKRVIEEGLARFERSQVKFDMWGTDK